MINKLTVLHEHLRVIRPYKENIYTMGDDTPCTLLCIRGETNEFISMQDNHSQELLTSEMGAS